MANRAIIIKNLIEEITEQIFINNIFNLKNDLKKYPSYFTSDEIKEYDKKIEILRYIQLNNSKENIEVIIYYLSEIKNYLITLKEKREIFLQKIFQECLNSLYSQKNFSNFTLNSEFYFINYRHYFLEEEVQEYNQIWFELEEENALLLLDENEVNIYERWETNYDVILKNIIKMLQFINKLE